MVPRMAGQERKTTLELVWGWEKWVERRNFSIFSNFAEILQERKRETKGRNEGVSFT